MQAKKKTTYRIDISSFLGVDFANDETEVDIRRSPYAPNITADVAGRPSLRPGYEKLFTLEGRINGIHMHRDCFLIHHGTALTIYDGTTSEATAATMSDALSTSFSMNGKTYILDGTHYYCYDGSNIAEVSGYIPTTTIAAPPAGGGTSFEAVNLLTPMRKNSFIGDGATKTFYVDAKGLDATAVTAVVNGTEMTEGNGFTVTRSKGRIAFTTAPQDGAGVDNVVITFGKTISGNRNKIAKCTIAALYGLGNDTRVFLTGNEAEPNTDYQSALYDPEYFPDTGYTKIGGETAIRGYLKQYGELIIVKEEQGGESGIYLRTATQQEDGSVIFPVKEGVQGIGAISKRVFKTLRGDPMFLSRIGVMGLSSDAVTNQQTVQLRSWFVNPRLLTENALEDACAEVWGRYLVIAINNNFYVANCESLNNNKTSDYGYEWYFWKDIPARVLKEHEGRLYFGTEDGEIMRFKDPEESGREAYSDDGEPIEAIWTTPLLDGGNFMQEKNILKRGTGILTKPFARSSGEIFFTTDKSVRQITNTYQDDIFDFNDVDFKRFTFNTRDNPQVKVSPKKFKRVLQFQMGVRHNEANSGFGILGMMISFTMGKMAKKKQ